MKFVSPINGPEQDTLPVNRRDLLALRWDLQVAVATMTKLLADLETRIVELERQHGIE